MLTFAKMNFHLKDIKTSKSNRQTADFLGKDTYFQNCLFLLISGHDPVDFFSKKFNLFYEI